MEMGVQPEGVAETLDKADGAAPGAAVRSRNGGTASDRGKNGAHEDLQNVPEQRRVAGKPVA